MAKFKFSLEKVLRQRHLEVDIAKKNFIDAQNELDQEKEKLQQLVDLKNQSIEDRHRITSQPGSWIEQVNQINQFITGQDQRIKIQNQRLLDFEKVVEAKREILKVCLTEAKIIEKLKEKKKAEFINHLTKQEQEEMDELAVLRFSRNENQ